MAKLRGGVQGSRGPVTRLGHQYMYTWANTWEAKVAVGLDVRGDYVVTISPYGFGDVDRRTKVIVGNAHEDVKPLPPVKPRKPRVRRPKPEPVCVME